MDKRAEFYRSYKPTYARKFEQKVLRRHFSVKPYLADDSFIREMEKIDHAQSEGHYHEVVERCSKCFKWMSAYTESQLQNKMALKAQLHSYMASAYLELGDCNKARHHHLADYQIDEHISSNEATSKGACQPWHGVCTYGRDHRSLVKLAVKAYHGQAPSREGLALLPD